MPSCNRTWCIPPLQRHTIPHLAGNSYWEWRELSVQTYIFFAWVDGPSLCRHWCNPQSLIAASHNGIFNADGFGPASSFLVYCGADFAWCASLCTALFSPLGAGGAGGTPRRVRAAYSRTRCWLHPKGWASTPTGRFCATLTYCSYYTFPRTSCLSALRAEVDSIYPARKSNALLCPCPGHFTEAKSGTVRAKNAPGGRVHLPSLPAFLRFCFWGEDRSPHNRSQRGQHRISPFWRYTDTTRPAGGSHKPSQGLTRASAFLGCGVQFR